jgi:ABC-type long-subunit fatty acid transport system fused permease/ATPase subunit
MNHDCIFAMDHIDWRQQLRNIESDSKELEMDAITVSFSKFVEKVDMSPTNSSFPLVSFPS